MHHDFGTFLRNELCLLDSSTFVDEEIANVCLMAKSMNDQSTSEEVEVSPDFEELLVAFNEMHEEAGWLVVKTKERDLNGC